MSKHPCVATLDKSNKNLINIINTTKSNKPFGVLFDNGIKEVHPVLIPGSISLNRYMSPIAVTYKMEEGETVSNNKACFSVKFLHLLFNKYNIVDSDLSAIKEYSDFCVLNGKSVSLNAFFKNNYTMLGMIHNVVYQNHNKNLITYENYFKYINKVQSVRVEEEGLNSLYIGN